MQPSANIYPFILTSAKMMSCDFTYQKPVLMK